MKILSANNIKLFFLCFIIICGCSKTNHYESEEQKAFNDVFPEIFKDDYESLLPYMDTKQTLYFPEMFMNVPELRQELVDFSKHPEKYDSVLSYYDNYHKPFFKDFTRLLIEAKGSKKKIDALLKSASEAFTAYNREILNKSRLFLYTDNKLLPFRDIIITPGIYRERYDSSYFYQLNLKELEERDFNYSSIKNTGRIELKDSTYPDAKIRKRTPEMEMGKITFSRIAFNPDFTKGKFILFFYNNSPGDKVTSMIYIEKIGSNWHYKSIIKPKYISVE